MCRSVALFARFDSASALFVKKAQADGRLRTEKWLSMTHLRQEAALATVQKHKGVAQGHIYINGNIKGRHNAAPALQRESTTWRDSGSQNPSLIHPRKTPGAARWGGEERSERLCFVFASSFTNSGPNRVSFLRPFPSTLIGLIGTCWQRIPSVQEQANRIPASVIPGTHSFHLPS